MNKRERYERSNMRGGMGVRKRLSEESLRETYRLNGVQTGSVVVRAHDKYFADFTKGYDIGTLVRKTASTVYIHWLGDEDFTTYAQGDARYEVDRGRWKFLGVIQGNPLDPQNPVVDALNSLRLAATGQLTRDSESEKIDTSANADAPTTEEIEMEMSNAAAERAAAKKALENGDFQDRETYTAKQVAGRCGTDAKTMRKFFRSSSSTVEPVGQGGRYEFDAKDLPKIKREFDAWTKKSAARNTKPMPKPEPAIDPAQKAEVLAQHDDPDITLEQLADAIDRANEELDEEPTPEELAELEGDLDLDDLDALDIED